MDETNHRAAEYRRQLIEFVRRRLSREDQDEASDFVQEALLEAQERAELLRALTPKQTLAWLVSVLRFKVANAHRTRQRRNRLGNVGQMSEPEAAADMVDRSPSPADLAERNERVRRITKALGELTDGQRLAIVLAFTPAGRSTKLRGKPGVPGRRFTK